MMKLAVLFLSVCLGQEHLPSKCLKQQLAKRETEVKNCKTRVFGQSNEISNEDRRQWRANYTRISQQASLKNMALCKKAEEVYEPNGLIDEIPVDWGCIQSGKLII